MPDHDGEELIEGLSFALRYRGRKRVHDADSTMALIAAERLVDYLGQNRFVVMKRPPAAAHSDATHYRGLPLKD